MRKPCRSLGFGLTLFSLIFCQAQSLFAQVKGAPLPAPPPSQPAPAVAPAPSQPAPAVAPAPARSVPKEGDSTSKEVAAQDEMAPEDSSEKKAELGVYFELFGIALFSPTGSTNPWAGGESCPSLGVDGLTLAVPCDARAPIGAALGGRLGLKYGVLGIELFGLGAGDWSQASLDTSNTLVLPSFLENTQVGRVGGGLGGGLRLSTPGKSVRLSAGAGAGVMFRHVYTNLSVIDGTKTGYASPLLLTDVSLLFGKTLSLGIVAWVEFSRDITVAAQLGDFLPGATELPITLFSGPQFFLGPTIALHFGQ